MRKMKYICLVVLLLPLVIYCPDENETKADKTKNPDECLNLHLTSFQELEKKQIHLAQEYIKRSNCKKDSDCQTANVAISCTCLGKCQRLVVSKNLVEEFKAKVDKFEKCRCEYGEVRRGCSVDCIFPPLPVPIRCISEKCSGRGNAVYFNY